MPEDLLTMATASDQQLTAKCYLLDIPGELRNRIYEFTQEQHPITFLSRRFDKGRYPKLPFYCIDKVEPDYYALTQVCRQLRAEYTPIYAATTEVRVDEYDLGEYMGNKCPMLMRDRYGKVFGHLNVVFKDRNNHGTNILPFLRYCQNKENLWVRASRFGNVWYKSDWKNAQDHLHVLLDAARRPKVQKWLSSAVDAIFFSYHPTPQLQYNVKEEHTEDWMEPWDAPHNNGSPCPASQRWSEKTGITLDGVSKILCSVCQTWY